MPTIKQLPVATSVSDTDLIPVSQGGTTKGLLVGGLLSSVQPAISLATTKLLGRVSPTAGGPEPVSLGAGLAIAGGTIAATGGDHLQLPGAAALGSGDEVVVNSGGAAKRMAAVALRALFSAGSGITIDGSGIISSLGLTVPATVGALGAVKPGGTLSVAADGTLDARVGAGHGTVAAGDDARIVSAAPLAVGDLRRFGWLGDGSDESAKIQAAHDSLPAAGGRIIIPGSNSGTGIGATINISKPTEIVGLGDGPNGQVLLVPTTPTVTMFNVTGSFSSFDNLSFGPRYPGTIKQSARSYITVAASAGRFRATRLMMIDFFEGITVTGNLGTFEMSNCRGFLYATGKGQSSAFLHMQGGLDVRVSNIILNGPSSGQLDAKAGIWIENLGDATFSQCNIVGMGTDMLVAPGNGQVVTSLWISDSFFDTAYRGLDLAPSGTGIILRSRMSSSWASSHQQEGIRVGSRVDGFDISDSHVFLNGSHGIALNGGNNVRVLGSQIAQNGNNGVYVAPGVSDWTINCCEIGALSGLTGNMYYPVYVDVGASDRYSVSGNRFHGNGTDAVQDLGTGLHKNIAGNLGDIYGYRAYRDLASGHLRSVGMQTGYAGFDWFANDGTLALAQLDVSGLKVLGSTVLTTTTGQLLGSANEAVRVAAAAGNVAATSVDTFLLVKKTTGAATTVTLEASPATGRVITIKDGRGDAATNPITVVPASGTIDGAATMILSSAFAAVSLIFNGMEWSVL